MNENEQKNTQTAKKFLTVLLPKDHPVMRVLEGQEFEFAWGSFQYDTTAALYKLLCEQEVKYGRETLLTEYDIQVGKVQPFEGDVLEGFKEALCVDVVDPEVVGDDTTEIRKTFEHVKTVTEALHFLRDQAWDLWCGVPYLSLAVFPVLKLGNICNEHKLGTICWLLKSYGYVENDEPFKDWDT